MFCPVCRSEYRAGFTRCEPCDADLVASPDAAAPAAGPAPGPAIGPVPPMVDYCGFFELDEARADRDRLRANGILARISLRESPPGSLDGPVEEEAWLLVPRDRVSEVAKVLGYDPAEAHDEDGDGSFRCNACGASVGADDDVCSGCGARFEVGP